MSTNQVKRLRTMLRHSETKPSWVRLVRDPLPKTAVELADDLDWDGRAERELDGGHRDSLHLWSHEVSSNMYVKKGQRDPVLQRKEWDRAIVLSGARVGEVVPVPPPGEGWGEPSGPSYAARAVSDHRPRHRQYKDSAAKARPRSYGRDRTASLEEDNEVLRRQVRVLLEQVGSGERKLPQLNLGQIPRPPSTDAPSGSTFITEPPATDRGRRLSHRRPLDADSDALSRRPSGSQTDRPRLQTAEHAHAPISIRSATARSSLHPPIVESDAVGRPLSPHRHARRAHAHIRAD